MPKRAPLARGAAGTSPHDESRTDTISDSHMRHAVCCFYMKVFSLPAICGLSGATLVLPRLVHMPRHTVRRSYGGDDDGYILEVGAARGEELWPSEGVHPHGVLLSDEVRKEHVLGAIAHPPPASRPPWCL